MTQAIAASKFTGSMGVNVDLDFFDTPYKNASAVAADLDYLGIRSVRDILPAADAVSLAPYAALAAAGVKFDLIAGVGGFGLPMTMAAVKAQLDAFTAKYPGALASVEGPNEPNIYPFSYAGHTGTAAAVAYEADLYKTVTSDPALKGVTVTNFAFGGVGADTYAAAGNESAIADGGNIHVYPDGNGGAPQPEILNEQALASVSTVGKPMAMTEFGYSTYAGGDISQAAQASYELDGILDAARDGISNTFLYELVDGNTGSAEYEENFGQFQSDAITPKASAVAIHNMNSILSDAGTIATLGSLAYTVTGLTASGGNSLLMEKSSGAFDIAVWSEPAATSLSTSHDAVTIGLGATYATVEVFDPTIGSTAVSTLRNVSSVSLDVTGHPLIVEVEPGLTTVPVTVPAPPPSVPVPPAPVRVPPNPAPSNVFRIAATQSHATVAISDATVTSTSGNHVFFIDGTRDSLTATGGAETVTSVAGNSLTTGSENDMITFGSNCAVNAGGGTNTLYDTGKGSTIVIPEAGKGIDLIHGSLMTNGDVFDLRDMLMVTTWSGASNADLGDYIHIRTAAKGADSIISVARTGSFSEGSHDVAHLYGTGALSLTNLLAHSMTT